MTLQEVENLLCGDGSESLELQLRIIKDIGVSAVALFAFSAPNGMDELKFAGSGTLITDGISYWILTAAHVWKEILASAQKLEITLRENADHRFFIDINALEVRGFQPQGQWNEWGPDLILLRIPLVFIGTIEAYKSFYCWKPQPVLSPPLPSLECFYLLGSPGDLGTFTRVHANVEIRGFLILITDRKIHAKFDFIDVDACLHQGSVMQGFGGVSGGGLWRVRIFVEPATDQPVWTWTLEGTAFFQFPVKGNSAIIRCHGPESIRKAIVEPPPMRRADSPLAL